VIDALADLELVPLPASGRRFTESRRVRWGDTDPSGRLRLDAVARYLQDVANDDTRDAGHDPLAPWVVRRTAVRADRWPRLGEIVTLTTFSGGHGSRWAERRTVLEGDGGGRVDAAALWVFVDPATGLPKRLTPEFHATYDEAAGGRTVGARLRLPGLSDRSIDETRTWPVRCTDLDALGHVNNAATWSPVDDGLQRRGLEPRYAELEYGDAIGPGDELSVHTTGGPGPDGTTVVGAWLTVGGAVRAAAHVRAVPTDHETATPPAPG